MSFMKGRAPIRRTLEYLNAGRLVLKDKVKIFSVNYNTYGEHHDGARDFVFWNIPQVQYKNPAVQVVTFKNMTPSPFVRCYFEDGRDILIDIDSKNRHEIMDHLMKVVGKTKEQLDAEARLAESKDNPANFGHGCNRHCICEIPGQVPCPALVKLPDHMRGKHIFAPK
ncbi:small ribosomal subunit protein mS25-like [Musca vetustissima]|uniref:small ribosomal subunit protein mS25-like n=1 Tax=Musca vetustissima TaxID=27455 RepID=UPI002AB7AB91|nr:small ribosomal subunit protein mS25-like [Musca vetustissima]XP_061399124.1 small ribosomal subunit protein mS25-like [Musca vetustissima]